MMFGALTDLVPNRMAPMVQNAPDGMRLLATGPIGHAVTAQLIDYAFQRRLGGANPLRKPKVRPARYSDIIFPFSVGGLQPQRDGRRYHCPGLDCDPLNGVILHEPGVPPAGRVAALAPIPEDAMKTDDPSQPVLKAG
jgi:hypothetical protein